MSKIPLPKARAISKNNGITWEEVKDFEGYGLKAKDGDRLIPSKPVSSLDFYNDNIVLFKEEDFPQYIRKWSILRKRKGKDSFIKEKINVNLPGHILAGHVLSGGEGLLSGNTFSRMRKTSDGKICAIAHKNRLIRDKASKIHALFIISEDSGYNWELISEIPYDYEPGYDEKADLRVGFTEPYITFLPDGSDFCLLRTTDRNGVGPMYWSRSTDNLRTWSRPKYFDRLGVFPELITLDNGITLASYGRPGLFVRATPDSDGAKWDEPVEIVTPGVYEIHKDTCSYTGMVALDKDTALLVYTDFNFPDKQGVKRKTILARTVTVQ
jgi:hypothetical protein